MLLCECKGLICYLHNSTHPTVYPNARIEDSLYILSHVVRLNKLHWIEQHAITIVDHAKNSLWVSELYHQPYISDI